MFVDVHFGGAGRKAPGSVCLIFFLKRANKKSPERTFSPASCKPLKVHVLGKCECMAIMDSRGV